MAQHDYVIDNASGATVRADINSALGAIQSLNSGTSAPSSTAAGMLWLDTTGGAPYALKVRDAGNNHWLTLASVTDPGSDGNIETSATIKGTIDSSADLSNATFPGPPSAGTFNGGHIVQITTNTSETDANGSGTILAVSHSITMSDSSNKLLVFATMQFQITGGSTSARYAGTQLVTSGSGVTAQTYQQTVGDATGSYGIRFNHSGFSDATFGLVAPINYLFSPAYQGAVTVTANVLGYSSAHGTIYTNVQDATNGSSTIILMEVVA